jgi:hypothetical protein
MHLWPYALCKVATDMNKSISVQHQELPIEKFASVPLLPHPRTSHPFGCPMYVLNNALQQGHTFSKWVARSRIAIYLGPSPNHAANVGLALSLSTGLVSPVFHAKYDNSFVTVQQRFGEYLPKSYWQIKCGFRTDPSSGVVRDVELTCPLPTVTETPPNESMILNSDNTYNPPHTDVFDDPLRINSRTPQRETLAPSQREGHVDHQSISHLHDDPPISSSRPRSTRSGRQIKSPNKYAEYDMYETAVYH